MNFDSFENGNQYNRRELLTFISFFGVMGTIAFLLNGCSLSRGLDKSQVKFSLTDGESVPNSWKVRMVFQFKVML